VLTPDHEKQRTMKKLWILLANIFLLSSILALSSCATTEQRYVTVFSGDGNVSLFVPSGWNTDDTTILPEALVGVSDRAGHEYLVVAGEPRSNLGVSSSVDDYLAQIKTSSVSVVPDGVWGNSSSTTIGGFEGLTARLTGTWIADKTATTFFVNVLANNNYYYAIVGFTDTSLLAANGPTLQKIIDSFKAPATSIVGGWKPYSFPGSAILSFILLIVAASLVFLGRRLKNRVNVPRPGKVLTVAMVAVWAILILVFLTVDIRSGASRSGAGPIFPITLACAGVTFSYLFYIFRREGFLAALGNGFVGAAAGPMVFEFPFDLIVIPQIKAPTTFLIAYFVPLDFAVLLTLSLILLSRHVSISKYSLYALAGMFIVFVVWALLGFAYPSTPVSFIPNAVSKVLGFLSVAALFSRGPKEETQDEIMKSSDG
jgi:hypothetical protein